MHLHLANGLNKVIADQLGIAMRTVAIHRSRMFTRRGCPERCGTVQYGEPGGFVRTIRLDTCQVSKAIRRAA